MNIFDLMRKSSGWTHLQGKRTRMFVDLDGTIHVHGQSASSPNLYGYELYKGKNETEAAAAFSSNEEGINGA